MGKSHYTIQYGTHHSGEYVSFGINEPLEPDDSRKVFEYVRRHVARMCLAAHCELGKNIPEASEPHTLINLHGFEGRIDSISTAISAKLLALGHTATIDSEHRVLSPDVGIGLFFKATELPIK